MRQWIVMVGVIALSLNALAGGDIVGNGGDAVVCKSKRTIDTVEMLDLYEARIFRGWKLVAPSPLPPVEQAVEALAPLQNLDPARYARLRIRVEGFMADTVLMPDADLEDISDSEELFIPKDCDVEQIVIRRKNILPKEKRFVVNKTLWDEMDEQNQAALILHEVIYEEHFLAGEPNSLTARYLTGLLMSEERRQFSLKDYFEYIEMSHLPLVVSGLPLRKGSLVYNANSELISAHMISRAEVRFVSEGLSVDSPIYGNEQIDFHTGTLIPKTLTVRDVLDGVINGYPYTPQMHRESFVADFHSNGLIKTMMDPSGAMTIKTARGKSYNIAFNKSGDLQFDSKGKIQIAESIKAPLKVVCANGMLVSLDPRDASGWSMSVDLSFNSEGEVTAYKTLYDKAPVVCR